MKVPILGLAMGLIISVGAYGAVSSTEASAYVATQIKDALDPLPGLLAQDPTGLVAQKYLNERRLVMGVIQPYFYNVPGGLHEHSPARQILVEQVETWLNPYESILLQLAQAGAPYNSVPDAAVQILSFARPTAAIKEGLLAAARNPTSAYLKASEFYNTLFLLQLDDQQIKQEVLGIILHTEPSDDRYDLSRNLLGKAANRWALPELEPLYRELLSIPLRPENFPAYGKRNALLAKYAIALNGLAFYGTLGASYADLVKARLAELNPRIDDDANLLVTGKDTLEILEGKRVPKFAVTWKGQLLGVSRTAYSQWLATHGQPSAVAAQVPASAAKPGSYVSRLPQDGLANLGPSQPLKDKLIWLIVLGVAALLWFLFKSKRK
jgi:hypothetical protein